MSGEGGGRPQVGQLGPELHLLSSTAALPPKSEHSGPSNDGRTASSSGFTQDGSALTGSATSSDGSGWLDYTVRDGDSVRSVAARFDITPSRLKKFNRMTVEFIYPGQVIMIPLGSDSIATAAFAAAGGGQQFGPRKKSESRTHKDPMLPVTVALSESEEAALDLQCLEMFIKLPARHVTDSHGVVPGTLLVTPNGVMFDPDLTAAKDCDITFENIYVSMKMISSATAYKDLASSPSCKRFRSAVDKPPQPQRAGPCEEIPSELHNLMAKCNPVTAAPGAMPSSSSPEGTVVATGRASASATAQSSAASATGFAPDGGTPASDSAAANHDNVTGHYLTAVTSESQSDKTICVTSDVGGGGGGEGLASDSQPNSLVLDMTAVRDNGRPGSSLHSPALSEPAVGPEEFFLCLRTSVATTNSSTALDNEQYNQRIKTERWFVVTDGDKLESLYSFLLKWKPDAGECHHTLNGLSHVAANVPITVPAWQQELLDVILNVGTLGSPLKRHCRLRKEWEVTSNAEVRVTSTLMEVEKDLPLPATDVPSAFLTESQRRQLAQALPFRIEGNEWHLVYSTEVHGFSLSQLYLRMRNVEDSPILLVLQDTCGTVFGALTSCPLAVSDHFYGTGESFLFTFADRFRVYPWTGENNLFIRSSIENLWIGTGKGTFGLFLDGDLCQGRTQHCKTYNNDPLTGAGEDFVLKHLEAWCFFT